MEACVGGRHLARQVLPLRHDAQPVPAINGTPLREGQMNGFCDAKAISVAKNLDYAPLSALDRK
jgi:hypothetical protein